MSKTSTLSGFYKLNPEERLKIIKEFAELTDEEADLLTNTGALQIDQADRMIENVIGVVGIPFGIGTNFLINGKDYLIPMAIEEPSVIAAASNAAKMARVAGGFQTSSTDPVMIGQIQVVDLKEPEKAAKEVLKNKDKIIELANSKDSVLIKFGGGVKGIETKVVDTPEGKMLGIHLLVDTRDAMGANAVNTMAEAVAPMIEEITGGRVILRIISNLAVHRLARAKVIFSKDTIGGEDAVDVIIKAYAFANADIYRATTHNKGIMNGIVAVALATGNDHRAIEAGAHAYAAIDGRYKPLTKYYKNKDGDLVGEIELPMAVGTVGGATRVHPIFKIGLRILGVKTSQELGEVMAAVGLAQNFSAMRALATEGIQSGHMSLHARNIAVMAGAKGEQVDAVVKKMVEENNIRIDRAKEILESM